MALTYTYPDAYLAKFCTEEREDRALADVVLMEGDKTFSADWIGRLTVVQCYILACLEHQAGQPEDLFTAKLKSYREELKMMLPRAIADADATADVISTVGTFPVERA
jgi:hypothetical protein